MQAWSRARHAVVNGCISDALLIGLCRLISGAVAKLAYCDAMVLHDVSITHK